MKYDIVSDCWVGEDGGKTNFPFGVHQIHEEIVAPIVQNLMEETRLERMKIYNNIKDQKISITPFILFKIILSNKYDY